MRLETILLVMITAKSSNTVGAAIPAKKSIFNKPSWSKPQALTNGEDLFRRSNQKYVDLAVEKERQRKRKLARKEEEQARRTEDEKRPEKRQRTSESEDDDDDDNSSTNSSSFNSDHENPRAKSDQPKIEDKAHVVSPTKPKYSPKSLLKNYEASIAANKFKADDTKKTSYSHVIDLEDEDVFAKAPEESGDIEITNPKPSKTTLEDSEPISDEEFPELARQAREMVRRKRMEDDLASTSPDPLPTTQDGFFSNSQTKHQSPPLPPPPDPILQILITSSIPNTAPLIVNRKLSQRLKDVRVAWVERQHLPTDVADKVFLTWRGKRLFDVTSCRSLGIGAGPNGRILAKEDNVIDDEGRIHMEAMTLEIFEVYKKAKRNDRPSKGEDTNQDKLIVEEKQEAQVKIICRAKGFTDFKLIVKPVWILHAIHFGLANGSQSTMVSKICNAFRAQNQIEAGKEVYLMFDGEKLSPESKVEETELNDMDKLDVFIK